VPVAIPPLLTPLQTRIYWTAHCVSRPHRTHVRVLLGYVRGHRPAEPAPSVVPLPLVIRSSPV